MRRRAGTALLLSLALSPLPVVAQSTWVPPKGELDFSVTYQNLESDLHLFSGLEGPTLTPLEIAIGRDLPSNELSVGVVNSHGIVLEADLGITDRLALTASVIAVSPRYVGDRGHPGTTDDGSYHPSLQDGMVGARYMIEKGRWSVTPFVAVTTPLADYEVLAHAAHGLGLDMLELGTSAGRILFAGGGAKAYLQGTYAYGLVDRPVPGISLNRSRVRLEGGYFLGRWSFNLNADWRDVHGGIEWSHEGHRQAELSDFHDQLASVREWRWGAGLSFDLTNGSALFLGYNDFIWGYNTHNARTYTFGVSKSLRAFGKGLTFGEDRG